MPSSQITSSVLRPGKMGSSWNFSPHKRKAWYFLYAFCWTVDQWTNVWNIWNMSRCWVDGWTPWS